MKNSKEFVYPLLMMFFITFSIFLLDSHLESVVSSQIFSDKPSYTVVIDAGHGGFDSGKVGVDGTLEKDVNLIIAKKLENLLKSADINVIMIRDSDKGLYTESSTNKKRQDMTARADLMNNANADCIISIHQNSYSLESIDGAQVFYYTGSSEGELLASFIQKSLISKVDPSNHRKEKSNSSYFLLKNAKAPIVIVECGFLSNWEESKKLVDDAYQQKLAWAIHLGILQYLNLHT